MTPIDRDLKYLVFLLLTFLSINTNLSAHPSWGIVVDDERNIYFADITHHGQGSVWKLTANGELKLLLKDFHAHNVSLDAEGNLITAHGETPHLLVRISPEGRIDTLFMTDNHKVFFGGNCTWSEKQGVMIYSLREHKYLRQFYWDGTQQSFGDYQFIWNQSLYAAPDGSVYASEIGRDNGCIIKIAANGESTEIACDLISKLDRPKDQHNDVLLGITLDDRGNLYVAETAGRRIVKIDEAQHVETFYQPEGDWLPTAIDFVDGEAYILEFNEGTSEGPRIVHIDESGKTSVLFVYGQETPASAPPMEAEKHPVLWWILIGAVTVLVSFVIRWQRYKRKA